MEKFASTETVTCFPVLMPLKTGLEYFNCFKDDKFVKLE